MKKVGLHLRFKDSITEILLQALELNLSIFQCFFTDFIRRKHIRLNQNIINSFKDILNQFRHYYAHGSYLINLAEDRDHRILKLELELCKRLEFKYLILHPGAFRPSSQTLADGIDCIVKNINVIMKTELDVILILENAAFGGNVIGGDISHFDSIFARLDFPERVKFCFDTAHAYVYGYDLNDLAVQEQFLQMLKISPIGHFIQLLHLNNSNQESGSKIDNHSILFEGKIRAQNLKNIAQDVLFNEADIIIEMPEVPIDFKKNIIKDVKHWF